MFEEKMFLHVLFYPQSRKEGQLSGFKFLFTPKPSFPSVRKHLMAQRTILRIAN